MSNLGFFAAGDRIQLTDPKGKMYSFTIEPGKEWHTHKGPKDAAMIVGLADIYPGARVLEAGVGSGALTISLLRAVGATGSVHSVERRSDFATNAEANLSSYFGGAPANWSLRVGDLQEQEVNENFDRVILDMLAPWECIDCSARALRPGGVFMAYVATTTQLSVTAEALKSDGRFTEPESSETIVRGWHHEGLAVRPQQRMIAHTGFLIQSRKMAPGVEVLARRRRPAKGAYGVSQD